VKEELLGRAMMECYPGIEKTPMFAVLRTCMEERTPQRVENEFAYPDGSKAWFELIIQPAGEGIFVLSLDVSKRKQAEEQIQRLNAELEQRVIERTSQLEAANKELEAFAYSVSHDLRAPLRAIDGFSRIILEDYAGRLDAEGNRFLTVVRTNTQKMDQLITDLLALSRAARTELQRARIDMSTMAASIYHELVPPEEEGNFQFSVSPLPDAWGDPTLMRQVWANLIGNAVKFTRPKEARSIEISGRREQEMNVYSVKDNGVGFDPAYAHKLFGIFQRLHRSEEFEGTGVGLAIVQRIIHRHGGRLWAEGKVNEGATFHFCLRNEEDKDGSF
jgi:light-regulated signal transduction histidine kinase (bacteriophytochrome)